MLSRAAVLEHVDLGQEVDVPELGGKARIRGLTVAEWDEVRGPIANGGASLSTMAEIVLRCWIDETGQRLFTNEDGPALARQPATLITRLAMVAQSLSGFGGTPEEREKN